MHDLSDNASAAPDLLMTQGWPREISQGCNPEGSPPGHWLCLYNDSACCRCMALAGSAARLTVRQSYCERTLEASGC